MLKRSSSESGHHGELLQSQCWKLQVENSVCSIRSGRRPTQVHTRMHAWKGAGLTTCKQPPILGVGHTSAHEGVLHVNRHGPREARPPCARRRHSRKGHKKEGCTEGEAWEGERLRSSHGWGLRTNVASMQFRLEQRRWTTVEVRSLPAGVRVGSDVHVCTGRCCMWLRLSSRNGGPQVPGVA